ncbi:MAG: 2'-5' ligase [Ignavibacteria bacterium]|nr:2'-5' ligase [Ignavibacteria bacterium]
MSKKRLFIGTFVDSQIFENILPKIRQEFSDVCKGKWVELHNLHFTYKFLGDVQDLMIDDLKSSIAEYLTMYSVEMKFSGIGAFPDLRRPKVLFVNFQVTDGKVNSIFRGLELKLLELGFPKETRPFKQHISLIRIKSSARQFNDIAQKYRNTNFGVMNEFKVSLIESRLFSTGPVYSILE